MKLDDNVHLLLFKLLSNFEVLFLFCFHLCVFFLNLILLSLVIVGFCEIVISLYAEIFVLLKLFYIITHTDSSTTIKDTTSISMIIHTAMIVWRFLLTG